MKTKLLSFTLLILVFFFLASMNLWSQNLSSGRWVPYNERYAVIVMGGPETGQLEKWYWEDTSGMYNLLKNLGFKDENIYFLAWGKYATYQSIVDRTTSKENVIWAFEQVKAKSTVNDLVYIFWVDHGTSTKFLLPPYGESTGITHSDLNRCIANIKAKVIIGAFNPCYSGAVIDDISRNGVISITSVNASQKNAFGWAGKWREALSGGFPDNPSDKNRDGIISMTEAYEWVAPQSQNAKEHPLFDDNGDKVGSEYNTPNYNPNDPTKDGFIGSKYSLTGWFWEISYNVAQYSHRQFISFSTPFSSTPIVLTSAQIWGRAVSSAAVDLSPQGFSLDLTDDLGRPVNNAWVQWIAFVPAPNIGVIGGIKMASHREHISFERLPATPVIVTNAQKDGKALISGAMNNAPDGFDLFLVNDAGNFVSNAWLLWIAVIPNATNGFKGEVKVMKNGDNISFTPAFRNGPSYILSAQPGVIAGAVNNRPDGFTLSLIEHNGKPSPGNWTQWLGYANP